MNGASSAVGSFAIKLAKMNPRTGPIIAIAGASVNYVREELGVDTVLDYRSSNIGEQLQQALRGLKLRHVFDAINSSASVKYLTAVLEPRHGRYTCTMAVGPSMYDPEGDAEKILKNAGVWYEHIWVGDIFGTRLARVAGIVQEVEANDRSKGIWFGSVMSRVFEPGLEDGTFEGHPFEIVQGGLGGVEAMLKKFGEGNRGNKKFVTRIVDTVGLNV